MRAKAGGGGASGAGGASSTGAEPASGADVASRTRIQSLKPSELSAVGRRNVTVPAFANGEPAIVWAAPVFGSIHFAAIGDENRVMSSFCDADADCGTYAIAAVGDHAAETHAVVPQLPPPEVTSCRDCRSGA